MIKTKKEEKIFFRKYLNLDLRSLAKIRRKSIRDQEKAGRELFEKLEPDLKAPLKHGDAWWRTTSSHWN